MNARKLDVAWLQAQQRAERIYMTWLTNWMGKRLDYGNPTDKDVEIVAPPAGAITPAAETGNSIQDRYLE